MDAAATVVPVARPVPQSSTAVTQAGGMVEVRSRKRPGCDDVLGANLVPPDVRRILAQNGPWPNKDYNKVFDWITDERGRAFQAMLVLVLRQFGVPLRQENIDRECKDKIDGAFDAEASKQILEFLEERLPAVVKDYVPEQCASFLSHLCKHLRCFLDIDLPSDLQPVLLKTKRTADEIKRVVEWIAADWRSRLYRIARWRGSSHEDAEDAVQNFLAAVVWNVVRNFNAEKGRLWSYLRFCFIRECGKGREKIERMRKYECSDDEKIEIRFEDTNTIPPDERLKLEELRKTVETCLARLPVRQRLAVRIFELEGQPMSAVAAYLKVTPGYAKKLVHDGRVALRKMLELQQYQR